MRGHEPLPAAKRTITPARVAIQPSPTRVAVVTTQKIIHLRIAVRVVVAGGG